jgi:hypothetical protein
MRILKYKLLCIASLCLLGALVVGCGLVDPGSTLGRAVFHIRYAPEHSRPSFLQVYQRSLKEYAGGYIPTEVDAFLINRLSSCQGTPEWSAILDFQLAQSSSRWGDAASQADDALKKQIIAYLIPTLETIHPSDALKTMVFIESLRRNNSLHKGGFIARDFYDQPDLRGPSTLRRDQLALAINSFRRWWGDGTEWPQNKSSNPLEGTKIVIYSGP